MKTSLLFFLAALVSLTACQQSDEIAPHEDVPALQEQFQGTYQPIQSVSNVAIDVNQDGKATTDMLAEISELPNMITIVSISGKSPYDPKPSFVFVHHWPKQWVGSVEPTDYDPNIKPAYDRKVIFWRFAFDRSLTQLLIKPDPNYLTDPDLYSPLQTVLVKGQELIEVTLTKRLYTTVGWQTVQIVTLYERFNRGT